MAFLCVSQQGEFKNTTQNLLVFGESPCQKLLAEKVEKNKKKIPVVFPHRFVFYRVFGRFSA
jgi:hypothetical protein